jgi:hypothetical protein
MVPSSTSRRAVLYTCALHLVTETSEVSVMGNDDEMKVTKKELKEVEIGSVRLPRGVGVVSISVVQECESGETRVEKIRRKGAVRAGRDVIGKRRSFSSCVAT